ncbi:tail fiber domain-containing protein [Tardiphaga sp. 538_B7_N1_4]|uniref:tail fiber domain-containing protein n=1 Tax=Tardiphaga sp. 538_B7_N1_4 TaxID=3240778 RepID=UPI003F28DB05
MGGESKTSQTQESTTNPWAPAQPALQGILSQLQGQLGNTGITANESGALNTLTSNAGQASQYAPQIQSYAQNLLNGGGATDQNGAISDAYKTYQQQTNPLASNTNYDPMQTPGLGQQLQTIRDDVGNSINSQFAAAGRDFSGANQQAYGRGVTQGMAPVLTAQYNQNVQNQQGAANNLYNAGNTTSGLLAGLNQQKLANQAQGVTAAGQATDAANAGANATLQAEAARRGIPVQALGLLAQIGIPIAGLGGQSTGKSEGTQQMSGAQQFGVITGGIGNLLKGFGSL